MGPDSISLAMEAQGYYPTPEDVNAVAEYCIEGIGLCVVAKAYHFDDHIQLHERSEGATKLGIFTVRLHRAAFPALSRLPCGSPR